MKRLPTMLLTILLCAPLAAWGQTSAQAAVQPQEQRTNLVSAKHEVSFNKMALPFNKRQHAAIEYQQALRAIAEGDVTRAIASLTDALKHEPQHIIARQLLASILIHRQELAKAQQVLELGTKLLPQEAAFSLMLARVYSEQQQPARGIALLENMNTPALLRNRVDAMLAALYQRVDRYDDAIVLYRHLLRRDPRQAMWWLGLAMSLEASHRPANALSAYHQARRAKPGRRVVEAFIASRIAVLSKTGEAAQHG